MQIFKEVIEELGAFKELRHAISNGAYPCSVTGVSGIHKAQFIFGMVSTDSPILVIVEDESTARRISVITSYSIHYTKLYDVFVFQGQQPS